MRKPRVAIWLKRQTWIMGSRSGFRLWLWAFNRVACWREWLWAQDHPYYNLDRAIIFDRPDLPLMPPEMMIEQFRLPQEVVESCVLRGTADEQRQD